METALQTKQADPQSEEFWSEEAALLFALLYPYLRDMILAGARNAYLELAATVDLGIAWDIVNEAVISWANKYTTEVVAQISKTSMAAFLDNFEPWLNSGKPLQDLIDTLTPYYGPVRARMIGTTEVTRAFANGNIAMWRQTGVVESFRFNTSRDELVCPICSPLDGQIFQLGDTEHTPALHVNCVLPGNEITTPGLIRNAVKSFYKGRVVEITFSSGRKITITPNHPVLRRDLFWVAAQEINQGDYLISSPDSEWVADTINKNVDNRPVAIEKIFESLRVMVDPVSLPASPAYFHGDGKFIKRNIDVINVNSLLLSKLYPNLPQHVRHDILCRRDMGSPLFSAYSSLVPRFNTSFSSLPSFMGSANLPRSLSVCHPAPFDSFSLASTSRLDTSFYQSPAKRPAIDSSLARQFVLRFAGNVALEKVVKVRNFDYCGHVYDLHVEPYGLYTCNYIIVSNCRCWPSPVVNL